VALNVPNHDLLAPVRQLTEEIPDFGLRRVLCEAGAERGNVAEAVGEDHNVGPRPQVRTSQEPAEDSSEAALFSLEGVAYGPDRGAKGLVDGDASRSPNQSRETQPNQSRDGPAPPNQSSETHERRGHLYTVLGLSKDAGEDEIRKAYKKLAVKHHPDKGGDTETFKEISHAYEILSDASKRRAYDQIGHASYEQGAGGFPGGGGGGGFPGGGFHSNGAEFSGFGPGKDPFEMFESFFGGGMDAFERSAGFDRRVLKPPPAVYYAFGVFS